MLHTTLVFASLVFVAKFCLSSQQATFRSTNDNRCFFPNQSQLLQNISSLANERQCAIKCSLNTNCGLFSIDGETNSCLLYPVLSFEKYLNMTTMKQTICKTWYKAWLKYAIFATSGQFAAPLGASLLKVIAIGGGAGGGYCDGGGGGSGQVKFAIVTVTNNQTFNISIGAGGQQSVNGGRTTFGGSLLVANGGSASLHYEGGAGGSGGGGGNAYLASFCTSGNGGSAGSNGSETLHLGGNGQGSSFSSYFNQFGCNTLTAGSGAAGTNCSSDKNIGGGGGGGVLLNNAGPTGGSGVCLSGYCGPGSATGFGAGGSGGLWSWAASTCTNGGAGADGLVYLEFY